MVHDKHVAEVGLSEQANKHSRLISFTDEEQSASQYGFYFTVRRRQKEKGGEKKLAASSMLHEAKIAYYAFDVIVYCMYTHQTRIAYTKQTH